ncbi:MAG: hypothetical protein ACE37F_03920 [Nannocystaceae bacterium]|nr:hypothetical protein [bacterium]
MTVAELMQALVNAGFTAGLGVVALPLLLGAAAYFVKTSGNRVLSQRLANVNIGLGFFALLVLVFWTIYAATVPGMIGDTNVLVFLAPLYLVGLAFVIEHFLHPDQQEDVRKRVRSVLLFIAILGVLYFVLSRLSMHMVIWTNVMGFVFFILALIGILYVLIRKVV